MGRIIIIARFCYCIRNQFMVEYDCGNVFLLQIVVQYASRRDVLTAGAKQIRERMAHFNSNQ